MRDRRRVAASIRGMRDRRERESANLERRRDDERVRERRICKQEER